MHGIERSQWISVVQDSTMITLTGAQRKHTRVCRPKSCLDRISRTEYYSGTEHFYPCRDVDAMLCCGAKFARPATLKACNVLHHYITDRNQPPGGATGAGYASKGHDTLCAVLILAGNHPCCAEREFGLCSGQRHGSNILFARQNSVQMESHTCALQSGQDTIRSGQDR